MNLTIPLVLTGIALLAPASLAGPPERPSGRMSFDAVAVELQKYGREADDGKRIAWLERLAPTRDPRVALLIWEYPPDEITPSQFIGLRRLLMRYYVPPGEPLERWWKDHGADLRRRAKEQPP